MADRLEQETQASTASGNGRRRRKRGLTARQTEVLNFIKQHIADTGYPPTRAGIAAELGFRSPNAAEEHLKALDRKGAIEIIRGASRGIRVLQKQPLGLPIVGRVAAGNPILAEEHIEDYCELPAATFHPEANFLLQVRGDSMIDAGILDGDLLAVHKTPDARNGDIVVARIEDEVTVKRLQVASGGRLIRLLPANDDYDPIEVTQDSGTFAIEGRGVGIIRRQM
ncbi:MAG: transcriptional repressor LexA [Gammaproteobacteria bacterium]|nr:transcriptional repressor LexA [Gammaproteobacteria bacterium]MXY52426.1 transcriptional repressor LexA [Gammaproteobacteria bacterium]MYB37726.1 transcriptional repressor LexA [Gammaproteobacteria bacterium]